MQSNTTPLIQVVRVVGCLERRKPLTHDLSHARHGRPDVARDALKLGQVPAGDLGHTVVQGRLEASLFHSSSVTRQNIIISSSTVARAML